MAFKKDEIAKITNLRAWQQLMNTSSQQRQDYARQYLDAVYDYLVEKDCLPSALPRLMQTLLIHTVSTYLPHDPSKNNQAQRLCQDIDKNILRSFKQGESRLKSLSSDHAQQAQSVQQAYQRCLALKKQVTSSAYWETFKQALAAGEVTENNYREHKPTHDFVLDMKSTALDPFLVYESQPSSEGVMQSALAMLFKLDKNPSQFPEIILRKTYELSLKKVKEPNVRTPLELVAFFNERAENFNRELLELYSLYNAMPTVKQLQAREKKVLIYTMKVFCWYAFNDEVYLSHQQKNNPQQYKRLIETIVAKTLETDSSMKQGEAWQQDYSALAVAFYRQYQQESAQDAHRQQRIFYGARQAAGGIHRRDFFDQLNEADVAALLPKDLQSANIHSMATARLGSAEECNRAIASLIGDENGGLKQLLSASYDKKSPLRVVIPIGPGHWQSVIITAFNEQGEKRCSVEIADPYGPDAARQAGLAQRFVLPLLKRCQIAAKTLTFSYAGPKQKQPDGYACGDFTASYIHTKYREWGLDEEHYSPLLADISEQWGNPRKNPILRHTTRVLAAYRANEPAPQNSLIALFQAKLLARIDSRLAQQWEQGGAQPSSAPNRSGGERGQQPGSAQPLRPASLSAEQKKAAQRRNIEQRSKPQGATPKAFDVLGATLSKAELIRQRTAKITQREDASAYRAQIARLSDSGYWFSTSKVEAMQKAYDDWVDGQARNTIPLGLLPSLNDDKAAQEAAGQKRVPLSFLFISTSTAQKKLKSAGSGAAPAVAAADTSGVLSI